MARNRVLSFMSSLSNRDRSPTPASPSTRESQQSRQDSFRPQKTTPPPPQHHQQWSAESSDSPQTRAARERVPGERISTRPMSMVQTYQPPLMELSGDTPPELQPIFTFLNSHGNKLYQEGYFLKLDDQNSMGKPNADRTWTECFAQLVGTILSLWDAAELDAAGKDGEVLPKFINLTDASIRIMEPLPTRSNGEPPLQNVLSISTAGKNRYLLHFNSHHSLIQWTAGIRLAMYEYTTLQEAYTGALIAGKGKALNNINLIMERSRFKHEEWVRVRFGAGTPWRRCWCVISPPDEKEYQKLQKELNKKKSVYDRTKPPVLKGDIKFYDTKKTKKVRPLAQITNAYSAFAIYPQSKPLIDASTLVKVEGKITIHSDPPSSTEGFVFVMPEVHAAVSGFEMMLRWLFPAWDTFAVYGRPGRLIADTLDPRSLMFAMPKERRYGYLEILDVTNLILTDGSDKWTEMEWRRRLKDLTQRRMTAISSGSRSGSRFNSRRNTRNSVGPSTSRSRVGFDDGSSVRSTPDASGQGPPVATPYAALPRTDSAPVPNPQDGPSGYPSHSHHRSVSESQGLDRYPNQGSAGYDGVYESAPTPPPHDSAYGGPPPRDGPSYANHRDMMEAPERLSGEDLAPGRSTSVRELQDLHSTTAPEPVARPPTFSHAPGTLPASKPYQSPELRKANIRMSHATLSQMTAAGAGGAAAAAFEAHRGGPTIGERRIPNTGEQDQSGVLYDANNPRGITANTNGLTEGVMAVRSNRLPENRALPLLPVENSLSQSAHDSRQHQTPNHPSNNMAPTLSFDQTRSEKQQFQSGSSVPLGSSNTNRAYPPMAAAGASGFPYEKTQGYGDSSSTDSNRDLSRLQTSTSVLRKPLPKPDASMTTGDPTLSPEPETASSLGSLGNHIIDQAAFDKVMPQRHPIESNSRLQQHESNTSLYEDALSTTSPDYASTIRSTGTRESIEKPRAGVARTVGGAEVQQAPARSSLDIPSVDFGPTLYYAAARAPRELSPARRSPARPQEPTPQVPPTNHPRTTHNPAQYRPESNSQGASRTVPWQPGMAAGPGSPSLGAQVITPQQFVQQRAASATSLYAHQRHQSSNTMRSGTPTPPLGRDKSSEYLSHSRNDSGDILQRPNSRGPSVSLGSAEYHSRNNSGDLLQRPSSRGAMTTLGVSGTGEASSRLSAREQEHVARVTGQPLINMAGNNRSPSPGNGLVGVIEVRERERKEMKQGLSSQTVQQEIVRRQQQAQAQQNQNSYQQYPQQYQQQYGGQMPQAQYHSPGPYQNYGEGPQFSGQPQRQSFAPPGPQIQRPQSWVSNHQGSVQRLPTVEQLQRQQQEQYIMQQRQVQGQGRDRGYPPGQGY